MNNASMDTFIKSYSDKNYKYPVLVRHKGAVIGFAMDDECRIWYTVLDLMQGDDERGHLDVDYWLDDPRPLQFTNEIVQTGFSIAGATRMPVVKRDSRIEDSSGLLNGDEIDAFWSSTGRLTADAPFQVLSDNKYLYIFRQSLTADQPGAVFKLNSGHSSADLQRDDFVLDAREQTVPVVNDTLLCDRFVLSGDKVLAKQEVRFRRSGHKTRPAGNKDSLGAKDMSGNFFFEPTQELDFIRHLKAGRFTVLRLPTQAADVQRWQFFVYNEETGKVDAFNMEQSEDGLFDTKGEAAADGSAGLRCSSFSFKERKLTSGLSAVLYHQQEKGTDNKPVKRSARVMLSAATRKEGETSDYIATLDFSVSRAGFLTLIPDEIGLPEVDNSQAEVLERISEKEREAQALRTEINARSEARDKTAMVFNGEDTMVEIPANEKLNSKAYTVELWIKPEKHMIQKTKTVYYGHPMFGGIRPSTETTTEVKDWYGAITRKGHRFHHICFHKEGAIHHRYKTPGNLSDGGPGAPNGTIKWDEWQHIAVTNDGEWDRTYVNGKLVVESRVNTPLEIGAAPIYIGCEEGKNTFFKGQMDDIRLWNYARSREEIASDMNIRLKGGRSGLVGYWSFQDGRAIDYSGNGFHGAVEGPCRTEQSPVTGSFYDAAGEKQRLERLQQEISQLKQSNLSGLSRSLDYLYMDPQGLTLSGALLKFAHAKETPHLLDSATGKLALYFRGSNDQFFAAYHDTEVSRTQQQIVGNGGQTLFRAAAPGEEMDLYRITVSEGESRALCTVEIRHSESDMLSEHWRSVPRESQAFMQVLNGNHPDYDYNANASAGYEGYDLSRGSLCFNVSTSRAGIDIQDGEAELTQNGSTTRWVADAPGQARVFDGQDDFLQLPTAQLEQVSLNSSLTMEAWINPLTARDSARILSQKDQHSAYSLAIAESERNSAFVFNGSDTYIDLPDLSLDCSGGFTVECWVHYDEFNNNSRIMDFANGPYKENIVLLNEGTSGNLALHIYGGSEGSTTLSVPGLLEKNTWMHLAVTIDGAGMAAVYKNGVKAKDGKVGVPAGGLRKHCYIGKSHWEDNGLLKGKLDDFRIWNYARSEADIKRAFNSSLGGYETGLSVYLQFNQNRVNELTGTVRDIRAYGEQSSTLSPIKGGAYSIIAEVGNRREQSVDTFITGQWNHFSAVFDQSYALRFSGEQWLNAGNADALNLSGALTIEAFIESATSSNPQIILGKGSLHSAAAAPYVLQVNTLGQLLFSFQDQNGNTHQLASPQRSIKTGQCHRVAVTRQENFANPVEGLLSGAGSINASQLESLNINIPTAGGVDTTLSICLHVDGKKVAEQEFKDIKVGANEEDLIIGGDLHQKQNGFCGTLSELRIWSRVLSGVELAGKPNERAKGLVAHWQLEENRGNVAHDAVGSYHAKINGAQWIKNPDPAGSTLRLFNNGVPLASKTIDPGFALTNLDTVKDQFTLGACLGEQRVDECFKGTLEEVRLWKTVRTQEQILDNLFTRLKGEKRDLIANYCFDDLQGDGDAADSGLRGNHLQQENTESRPFNTLSTAPVSNDTAQVRSALAGVRSSFHASIDSAPSVREYADLQYDADHDLNGIMKRCYAYIQNGQWKLITGYKVGNLITEWVGQAQFDPQIMGYMEGTPPVPSENMTFGTNGTGTGIYEGDGSSIELVQATEVSYNYSASREHGFDASFETSLSAGVEGEIETLMAPLGFGVSIPFSFSMLAGTQTGFESSGSWVEEKSSTTGSVQTRSLFASLGGNWEDPDNMLNPEVGRRWMSANMGFAVVQSETADVFALRLEHNNALVSFRFQPNPDIPKDWNILSFPINPRYVKQGTLDGKIGYDAQGRIVCDPDYPNAAGFGEHSYYKPKQAYALKRKIEREQQELANYYRNYGAAPLEKGPLGGLMKQSNSMAQTLLGMVPGVGAAATFDSLAEASSSRAMQDNLGIPDSFSKRNIANTYVWTADGGIFKETEETLDVVQETTGGSYAFTSTASSNMSIELGVAAAQFNVELDASLSGSMNLTQAKSKESSQSFSIEANVTCSGDMQRHDPHTREPIYKDGQPDSVAGRVDAYRWMTFYQQASRKNFEDLYNGVIDPEWLEQSDHPSALALRQARQDDKTPPCWRVRHLVTFVSRILPEFVDDSSVPMAQAMKKENVNSNWELIRKLEPFVKNKTADASLFANAVRQTLQHHLPELLPHADEVIEYLGDYYGVEEIS